MAREERERWEAGWRWKRQWPRPHSRELAVPEPNRLIPLHFHSVKMNSFVHRISTYGVSSVCFSHTSGLDTRYSIKQVWSLPSVPSAQWGRQWVAGNNSPVWKCWDKRRMGAGETQRRGSEVPDEERCIDKTLLERKQKQKQYWSLGGRIMASKVSTF